MTRLDKSISREMTLPGVLRPVAVTIDPETREIGFREKGCRKTYWYSLKAVYIAAIKDGRQS